MAIFVVLRTFVSTALRYLRLIASYSCRYRSKESICASCKRVWKWRYSSAHFQPQRRSVVSFTPRLFYPLINFPRYRLNRRLGGTQSWSKRFGGDSNLTSLPRIEPRFLDRPALTVATVAMRPLY
jgi:hypothetical protein